MTIANDILVAEEGQVGLQRLTDEFVCWSRMQAEAGQQLDAIVARKEMERRSGGGLFFWGVGNAPAVITGVLAATKKRVPVIFSIMKSRPKAGDVTPTRTLLWRKYVSADKIERPLPSHVVVTSRGGSEQGGKTHHFALMCYSDKPLRLVRGTPFDPNAYRNAGGTQAPVGASQVTALLRRVARSSDESGYEVNLQAMLVESYWVRLTDPIELSSEQLMALSAGPSTGVDSWISLARGLRLGTPVVKEKNGRQGLLL